MTKIKFEIGEKVFVISYCRKDYNPCVAVEIVSEVDDVCITCKKIPDKTDLRGDPYYRENVFKISQHKELKDKLAGIHKERINKIKDDENRCSMWIDVWVESEG